jgi:hypothetical protein
VHLLVPTSQSYKIQTGRKSQLLVSPNRRPNSNPDPKFPRVIWNQESETGLVQGLPVLRLSVRIHAGLLSQALPECYLVFLRATLVARAIGALSDNPLCRVDSLENSDLLKFVSTVCVLHSMLKPQPGDTV